MGSRTRKSSGQKSCDFCYTHQSTTDRALVDSLIAVGAFASTILSGGNTLIGLASLAAAAKAADSYKKAKSEEDALREESSFFYWEATKSARSRTKKGE
jgi:hypothetical protein